MRRGMPRYTPTMDHGVPQKNTAQHFIATEQD
jgi:hypothetical protein